MPFAIFFKDNPRDNISSMDLDNIKIIKLKIVLFLDISVLSFTLIKVEL